MIQKQIDTANNEAISIKIKCGKCNETFESEPIGIPNPDYNAETAKDSYSENGEDFVCDSCGKEFHATIWASFVGGYVDIAAEEDEIVDIVEHPSEEEREEE